MPRPPDFEMNLPADALERETMALAGDALAPLLDGVNGQGWALYVASRNAGTATSLRFWAEAVRTGVGLANPELFPWCLANAPCAALARRFGLNGPNTTWLGGPEAIKAAHQAAELALSQRHAPGAVVVDVDFAQSQAGGDAGAPASTPGRLLAWRLTVAD